MASNTENLNLLMKNPSTDGADTFNVQTMLNENWQKIDNNAGTVAQTLANILKPTTPPLIGLPPSTTPDGMFRALGNTGDLYVWRKTVVVGSYYIGASQGNYGCICRNTGSASFGVKIQYASEITVDSHENRNLVSPSDMTIIANNSGITSPSATSVANTLKGKFIRLAGIPDGYQNSELRYVVGSVFYCPESISCFVKDAFNDGNYYICLNGIKNVPTKTENVVTYPVSTNPNAYQEGDDAKEAGYTLREVVMGENILSPESTGSSWSWNYSDSVSVDENGVISLVNQNSLTLKSGMAASSADVLIGKYVKQPNAGLFGDGYLLSGGVFYIPNNAVVTQKYGGGNSYTYFVIDRYQPVTGYAAIPAGTTIEYLGRLGDKARVQVLSYVGTGTYGSSNPNSLTFDFVPKLLFVMMNKTTNTSDGPHPSANGWIHMFIWAYGVSNTRVASYNLTFEQNGKAISWYSGTDGERQCNWSGVKYTAVAIG